MSPPAPIRKRMKRREVPRDIRFVTFSCEKRLPLLGNAAIRDLFAQTLAAMHDRFRFELFAWVVMPEHTHILMRPPPDAPLDRVLYAIKFSLARRVIARWRTLDATILHRITKPDGVPRFWQKGGGFDRNVRDTSEFCRTVHYIHHNPVERALVDKPEDWAWSSVRWWMGHRDDELTCDPPPGRSTDWSSWRGFM